MRKRQFWEQCSTRPCRLVAPKGSAPGHAPRQNCLPRADATNFRQRPSTDLGTTYRHKDAATRTLPKLANPLDTAHIGSGPRAHTIGEEPSTNAVATRARRHVAAKRHKEVGGPPLLLHLEVPRQCPRLLSRRCAQPLHAPCSGEAQ